ncbi:hypothetical protein FIE12Z_4034 [Fusarium flagelliforme]|uniref:C2H2-type domain-containing protein n=1 Tax=Fusarium flagelliforme TaxID=2675880 RepID=A0A395MV14_9HYPO|nr:hypothetical protein FIE12Z_4034 [Fusarium flagelliforme]
MFYPSPAPDIDINNQLQPQGAPYNKPVANFAWAVPGGLSAINTNLNTLPQDGYTSESPLVMSALSNGYHSADLALLSRPNFNTQNNFSAATEWQWPTTQFGTSSQSLVPPGNSQNREVVSNKLRTLVRMLLGTRFVLRTVRQKNRRHSASDCHPWSTSCRKFPGPGPSQSSSGSGDAVFSNLSNEYQSHTFNFPDYTTNTWPDNTLGIWGTGENSQFPSQEYAPGKITELSDEEVISGMERELPGLLDGPTTAGNVANRTQRKVATLNQSKKRPIDCVNVEESSDDDTDDGSRGTKRSKKASTSQRFACPFYKHNPAQYENSRSCVGPGWKTVHRVKEHIFRSHKLPEHQCPRCFETFKSAGALSKHSRAAVLCQIQNRATQEEGIDAGQERQLKIRARKTNAGPHQKKVEEDRWNEMYQIVFPNEEQPSSPYYNRVHTSALSRIDDFERNIMDDFGQRVSARLGCLGMQQSLLTNILTITRSALQESVQSCRKGDADLDSQLSQLTASQTPIPQSNLGMGSQLPGVENTFFGGGFDDQLVAQILSDSSLGFSSSGSWNTLS